MTGYHLRCLGTGEVLDDALLPLQSEGACEPAFLRTEYDVKQLSVGEEADGLFRYANWLPARRRLEAPLTA